MGKTLQTILGIAVLTTTALAHGKGVICQPNRYSTHWMVTAVDQEVVFRVANPMGYSFMAQMETVSENSIPFLKAQTQDLKNLGEYFEYRWPRQQCRFSEKDAALVKCEGKVSASNSENGIPSLGFTTAEISEDSLSGAQKYYRVRAMFESGNTYFVTIPTAQEYCKVF